MESFISLLSVFNENFTLLIIFPSIILLGLYLSYHLNFVQVFKIKESIQALLHKGKGEGNISHYEAISAVLAGNLGTGNISGIAVALATGGPGAMVWMWLMAFLGGIIQFSSCVLGVKYREKNDRGEYIGGPMYYLHKGCHSKPIAACFALFAIFAAFTVGNFVQVNSVVLPLQAFSLSPLYWGVLMAIFVGIVILGGIQRFARVAASIVPLKAILYLGTCLTILIIHYDKVLPAMALVLESAFHDTSLAGGALGFGFTKVVTTGFSRGIFATDAGTGIAPMIQSSARSLHPIKDGIVAISAPFLVMLLCSLTSLVLIVTEAWHIPGLFSTNMCTYAFTKGLGSPLGGFIVLVSLILFAYTTILSWGVCLERAVEYLFGKNWITPFKYLYIALIPCATIVQVEVVWLMADFAIGLMMITNLVGVIKLSPEVITLSKKYLQCELEKR